MEWSVSPHPHTYQCGQVQALGLCPPKLLCACPKAGLPRGQSPHLDKHISPTHLWEPNKFPSKNAWVSNLTLEFRLECVG